MQTKKINIHQENLLLTIALMGFFYCFLFFHGKINFICHSQGCLIYKNYSLLGISFYLWGAGAFLVCSLLLLSKKSIAFNLFRYFCLCCFLIEIGLLIYQAIFLPCSSCLIAGLIWGGLFFLTFIGFQKTKKIWPYTLFTVWCFFFLFNLFSLIKSQIQPWAIFGSPDAPVKIFFSPTCPACKEVIKEIVDTNVVNSEDIALFPIAKNYDDYKKICLLQCELNKKQSLDKALALCWQNICPDENFSLWQKIKLRLKLLKNKIVLTKMGLIKIPIILTQRPLLMATKSNFFDFSNNSLNGCFLDSNSCQEN